MIFLRLFWEFFKTGLFSVGGGMATVPFLKDMVPRTGWFTFGELADMIAVAESTPGPIGVNMATYVGFTAGESAFGLLGGVFGAVVATLGLITPSIIVIIIVASILQKFRESKYVKAAFYGLRPASVGLIAAAGVSVVLIALFQVSDIYALAQGVNVNIKHLILAAVLIYLTGYCSKTKKLHPVLFIAASAVVGIVFSFAG